MKRLIILPAFLLISANPPRTSGARKARKTQQQAKPMDVERLQRAISLLEPLTRKI